MNPHGIVVNENTNGIVTVNGHSYEGAEKPAQGVAGTLRIWTRDGRKRRKQRRP